MRGLKKMEDKETIKFLRRVIHELNLNISALIQTKQGLYKTIKLLEGKTEEEIEQEEEEEQEEGGEITEKREVRADLRSKYGTF